MSKTRTFRIAAAGLAVAFAAAACSSSSSGTPSSNSGNNATGPVTLTWWHNGTLDPIKTVFQNAATSFHAANPNITISVNPIQNESIKTKIQVALQGNNEPDIFQQWGGGAEASQIPSGKLVNLTSLVAPWIGELGAAAAGWQVNGQQYGVPYDFHIVGFWYRKDLFARAGITSPPATIADLDNDVVKLKAANIAPISLGGKDQWPDAFYWDYFAVRECSTSTLKSEIQSMNLSDPCWTRAGNDLKAFMATNPFQKGALGTAAQQGAGSSAGLVANGQAAMELQGDWELGTMQTLTTDKTYASKLGWFPFPTVTGGQGDPSVVLGGGDGFSCSTHAASAADCADFLKYLDSTAVQDKFAASGNGLPANPAADSAITDPTIQTVAGYEAKATYIQTYFDIALPTAAGNALDAAVASFFAGQGTPQSVIHAITSGASGNK